MSEHYFTPRPTSKLKVREIRATLRGKEFVFKTPSSTFSPTGIDLGTKILIEHAQVSKNAELLDLGCGYGPVGIAFADIANVTLTDVNERATKYAKINAKLNNVKAEIVTGNMYEPIDDRRFDVILLNPPQTAGRKLCNEMIELAKPHLYKDGTLQIVARHQKGGKQFESKMKEIFGNVQQLAKQSGYRIYSSTNESE